MRHSWSVEISLSLALVAVGCGLPKGNLSGGESSTSGLGTDGASETGNSGSPPVTTGVSDTAPGDETTLPAETTDPTTPTTLTTTSTTSDDTGEQTSNATTGVEPGCVPDSPPPGSCDGAAPRRPSVRFTGAPVAGHTPPKVFADDADDEVFATTDEAFIVTPDGGGTKECDIFAQDCGPGEKCNAWADNGGSAWNATKCVPVSADPDQIGEPCTVDGSNVSGIDSCAKGAMCWSVDDQNQGVCVELCTCSEENPVCTTPGTKCSIFNDAVLVLCLPTCDPLDPGACPAGEVCIGQDTNFQCIIDASGDAGGLGDTCEFANACDPGFFCGPNDNFNPIDCDINATGCCLPFCDLDEPSCPAGLPCVPFFAEGEAPQCLEDVGACIGQP